MGFGCRADPSVDAFGQLSDAGSTQEFIRPAVESSGLALDFVPQCGTACGQRSFAAHQTAFPQPFLRGRPIGFGPPAHGPDDLLGHAVLTRAVDDERFDSGEFRVAEDRDMAVPAVLAQHGRGVPQRDMRFLGPVESGIGRVERASGKRASRGGHAGEFRRFRHRGRPDDIGAEKPFQRRSGSCLTCGNGVFGRYVPPDRGYAFRDEAGGERVEERGHHRGVDGAERRRAPGHVDAGLIGDTERGQPVREIGREVGKGVQCVDGLCAATRSGTSAGWRGVHGTPKTCRGEESGQGGAQCRTFMVGQGSGENAAHVGAREMLR